VKKVSALLTLGAFVFFILGGALYYATLEEVRPKLPPQFRDMHAARFALDNFVWETLYPARVRQKYLVSVVAMAAAFACGAMLLTIQGNQIPAGIAWCLTLLAIAYGVRRAMQYRHRLTE
jgi:hypothetical protein